jgi:hypothetical protein
VLDGGFPDSAQALARYVRAVAAALAAVDDAAAVAGAWTFPSPMPHAKEATS